MNLPTISRRLLACCVAALLAGGLGSETAEAVEPFRYPSGKLKNQPLLRATSLSPQKLKAEPLERVSPNRVGRRDYPQRYNRSRYSGARAPRR